MREDENIAKYVERIKASVSVIKASGGDIKETIVVSKVLRSLLPIYPIRVSTIQEMRCDPNKKLTLDALVERLVAFELDNYDNYVPISKNIELHLKPNSHLRKNTRNQRPINQKVKKKLKKVLTVILKILKPYLQRNIQKAKESTKVKFL